MDKPRRWPRPQSTQDSAAERRGLLRPSQCRPIYRPTEAGGGPSPPSGWRGTIRQGGGTAVRASSDAWTYLVLIPPKGI